MFANVFSVFLLSCLVFADERPTTSQEPWDCPPNEKYYKCSYEVCYKTCEDLQQPPPCPSISADCYKPSCECIDDFLRLNGTCIPYEKCPNDTELP